MRFEDVVELKRNKSSTHFSFVEDTLQDSLGEKKHVNSRNDGCAFPNVVVKVWTVLGGHFKTLNTKQYLLEQFSGIENHALFRHC